MKLLLVRAGRKKEDQRCRREQSNDPLVGNSEIGDLHDHAELGIVKRKQNLRKEGNEKREKMKYHVEGMVEPRKLKKLFGSVCERRGGLCGKCHAGADQRMQRENDEPNEADPKENDAKTHHVCEIQRIGADLLRVHCTLTNVPGVSDQGKQAHRLVRLSAIGEIESRQGK